MSRPLGTLDDIPIPLLRRWIIDATASEPSDPCDAALATATREGRPSVRMVLVKTIGDEGLSFYTNVLSPKGQELATNPFAALCFHWKSLRRQVRVEGKVSPLPVSVVEQYFHSRSRGSQIAAAVSKQSQPLEDRGKLAEDVAAYSRKLSGAEVPLPADWGGYTLKPASIEFWVDGEDRLHDRVLFVPTADGWRATRLYP